MRFRRNFQKVAPRNAITDARQILDARRVKKLQTLKKAKMVVASIQSRLGNSGPSRLNFKRNTRPAPPRKTNQAIVNELQNRTGTVVIQKTIRNERFALGSNRIKNTPKFDQRKKNGMKFGFLKQQQQTYQPPAAKKMFIKQAGVMPLNSASGSNRRQFNPNLGISSRLGMPVAVTPPLSQNYMVLVRNLHHNVSREDVNELFGDIGTVVSVSMTRPGSASVGFKTKEEAMMACKTYHNRHLDGLPMQCTISQPQPSISDRLGARLSSPLSHSSFSAPDDYMMID